MRIYTPSVSPDLEPLTIVLRSQDDICILFLYSNELSGPNVPPLFAQYNVALDLQSGLLSVAQA